QRGLQEIITYSKRIASEDFSSKLVPKSKEDELTASLNTMAQRLEQSKRKSEIENWQQKGINDLEDQMRGNRTVRELSSRIINFLCKFLRAELGAVYVYDEVLEHLELTGSSGIVLKDVQDKLNLGEGLIGKAAMQT